MDNTHGMYRYYIKEYKNATDSNYLQSNTIVQVTFALSPSESTIIEVEKVVESEYPVNNSSENDFT